jgi:hypothetical protein
VIRIVLASFLIAALPARAIADDTFEQKAAAARKVANLDEVIWSLFATCSQGDEVQQRQCRLVRDARARAELGATLLVEAEPAAFTLGSFDAAKKSVSLRLSSCIRCAGIQIDGKAFLVTGATPRVDGGKLSTALLYDTARAFPDESAAKKYIESVKGSRVQMVIKISDRKRWEVGGKSGLLVEVLAWRVVSPCTGTVLIASPASGAVEPDRTACAAPATPPTQNN